MKNGAGAYTAAGGKEFMQDGDYRGTVRVLFVGTCQLPEKRNMFRSEASGSVLCGDCLLRTEGRRRQQYLTILIWLKCLTSQGSHSTQFDCMQCK